MLEPSTMAPDFSLFDQEGNNHSLGDYRGKWMIIYFYPKDMTPGCTTEACNFRDDFPIFQTMDTVIIGISKDSAARHKKFTEKYQLPFLLLSDESGDVCEKYDVWKQKSKYGKSYMGIVRSTYLIDPAGKIAKVYPKVNVKLHAAELLNDLKDLR
jgi:peroxiredoxin Q/BCP